MAINQTSKGTVLNTLFHQRRIYAVLLIILTGCVYEPKDEANGSESCMLDDTDGSTERGSEASRGPDGGISSTPFIKLADGGKIEYVLAVSVDGLALRFVDQLLKDGELPSFALLKTLAAWTHNARADPVYTITLPNHTSMLTGRPVSHVDSMSESVYHGYTNNKQPDDEATLHNAGNGEVSYVNSVFDVAHDFGLKTCLFSGKDKFIIFDQSYDEVSGAPDLVGEDNGRDKIDSTVIIHKSSGDIEEELENNSDEDPLLDAFDEEMADTPCNFAFIHLTDTDPIGHKHGWGSSVWLDVLRKTDERIGRLLKYVYLHPEFVGKTALLITADHGGEGKGHATSSLSTNFTVPFYAVGPGFESAGDLYNQCINRVMPPGDRNPSYNSPSQPIRNADISNLALEILGLPAIEGSVARDMGCL